MKAILVKINEEYRDLCSKVHNQYWEFLRVKGFPEKRLFETGNEYIERVTRERGIICLEETECEILHIDYADFGCIVLHNDGTLSKESLTDIRIRDIEEKKQDNESSRMVTARGEEDSAAEEEIALHPRGEGLPHFV